MIKRIFILLFILPFIVQSKAQIEPLLFYKAEQDKACEEWVEKTVSRMSLKEKIGQLFIYTLAPVRTKANLATLREAVDTYKIGGLLFSGGLATNQANLTNYAQDIADVPLMITFDGEWGLGMRLKDTPSFPRNMVLGCIQDDRLIYEYGREVGRECRQLGIQVDFAPVADVNINPLNPVINVRSFGQNPHNVADKVVAFASGLESERVMAVAKHFPGHGDTDTDSHLSLPTLPFTRERLDSVELFPFRQAIRAGISGIMVGHLQVPVLEPDLQFPSSLSRNIVYGLLREELQFKGLIFTDALAMKGVSKNENVCAYALRAGNDMVLAPRNLKKEIRGVLDEIEKGNITVESIERKCRKVLMYKYALGLKHKPRINLSGLEKRINAPEAADLIRKLRLAAVTIVGNEKHVLPLHESNPGIALLSIGKPGADSLFVQGVAKYASTPHYRIDISTPDSVRMTLLSELVRYKRVIVSVTAAELESFTNFLPALSLGTSVVYSFFVPFKTVSQIARPLSLAAAVLLAHSDEAELQVHAANAIFGKTTVDGRLSVNIGTTFLAGEGVVISPFTPHYYDPEEFGMRSDVLARIDSIAREGIRTGAFPGCQIAVLKNGKPVYNKSFGSFDYTGKHPVELTDLYDLASLSKTTGTLLAIMKLYDKGKLNLTDQVSRFLPFLKGTNKADITVKELLLHESGLPAYIPIYREAIDPDSYKGPFFKSKRDASHRIQADEHLFASSDFRYKKGMVSNVPAPGYGQQVADSFYLSDAFSGLAMQAIAKAPLKGKKYTYSCINFVLLKEIAERISGMPMDEFLQREFYEPMQLSHTAYLPRRKFGREQIAPSAGQDFLRKGILQGYVHDEVAAFLGGVAGNAGLFSTAAEVAAVYQMLLDGGLYEGKRYVSEETCRLFTTQTSKISRRGLGFDKPDPENPKASPCSVSAPPSVFGHTGFTGTCAWADPDNNLVYVFLSNRTYPVPWNNKLQKMDIRPRIQETIYRSLGKEVIRNKR